MTGHRPNTFKVVQLNAENLFLFLDAPLEGDWRKLPEKMWQKLSSSSSSNKSLLKTQWLAESLIEINADVVFLNEVGGEESIRNFAKYFLNDIYVPHLIEGNSDRGIDIGYLVHRDFLRGTEAGPRFSVELRTHKNRPINFLYPHEQQLELLPQNELNEVNSPEKIPRSHYFSRDCAELRIYRAGETCPRLITLLVHLKSKLDPNNIDPQGKARRQAEMSTLLKIYRELREEFSPPIPIIVAGDFNGCARRADLAEEFQELKSTDLESVVDLANLEEVAAATQVQFSRGGQVQCMQIDFIMVSPELKEQLLPGGVEVFRYRSDLRVPLPLPKTLDQRLYLPSDHYPVVATFKNFL